MGQGENRAGSLVGFGRAAVVLALLGVGLTLRLHGIGRESFWHDEACSAKYSDTSIAEVLSNNARNDVSPLYHLGLFAWRRLLGDSDVRIRAYSTAWSMVGLLAIFLFANSIGGRRAALIALFLATVNPLSIYYAQEARMYSQAAALCALGSWCLWQWMMAAADCPRPAAWWTWAIGYTLCAAAAIYAHYLSVLILLTQGIFALLWFAVRRQWTSLAAYLLSGLLVAVAFLPWFLYVCHVIGGFYHPSLDWIPVPKASDYFSFLWRECFWGRAQNVREGWWLPTLLLAAIVLGAGFWRWHQEKARDSSLPQWPRIGVAYLIWCLAGPVLLAALAVAVYHPIYWRARFATFVLPPFLVLAAIACGSFRTRTATALVTAALAAVMLAGTYAQQQTRQKTDWRTFAAIWRKEGPPAQAVFFPAPHAIPVEYYLKRPLVSATRDELERLLPTLRGAEIRVCLDIYRRWPDVDYYNWLIGLGSVRRIIPPYDLCLQTIRVGEPTILGTYRDRLERWFVPMDIPGTIEGFGDPGRFYPLECDGARGTPYRWSLPKAWFCLAEANAVSTVVVNVEFPPPVPALHRPALKVFMARAVDAPGLFETSPAAAIDDHRTGAFEIQLRAPEGRGRLWIGWTIAVVNLQRARVSGDARDLGLRVNWVGWMKRKAEVGS